MLKMYALNEFSTQTTLITLSVKRDSSAKNKNYHYFLTFMLFYTCMNLKYNISSNVHILCSTEETNAYGFGTTWGWVNNKNKKLYELFKKLEGLTMCHIV